MAALREEEVAPDGPRLTIDAAVPDHMAAKPELLVG
jgi:hypothetical protein